MGMSRETDQAKQINGKIS